METIGIKEDQIKIKRTIFSMDPRVEKTTKVSRNIDSGTTQLQQMETLLHTLLRLEAIRANAYDRWQPFFNEAKMNFQGLVAYLDVFHNDQSTIRKLQKYFQSRQKTLDQLRRDRNNEKLVSKYQQCKNYGNELMEELREKIYSLQLTAEDFRSNSI
ncbi:MAG: hypothetical protein KW788_02920 [Candidatus Doudnabacteria bacterium]|nr:hypothetical protein [Candidatus Doudnabacteria bacterium]